MAEKTQLHTADVTNQGHIAAPASAQGPMADVTNQGHIAAPASAQGPMDCDIATPYLFDAVEDDAIDDLDFHVSLNDDHTEVNVTDTNAAVADAVHPDEVAPPQEDEGKKGVDEEEKGVGDEGRKEEPKITFTSNQPLASRRPQRACRSPQKSPQKSPRLSESDKRAASRRSKRVCGSPPQSPRLSESDKRARHTRDDIQELLATIEIFERDKLRTTARIEELELQRKENESKILALNWRLQVSMAIPSRYADMLLRSFKLHHKSMGRRSVLDVSAPSVVDRACIAPSLWCFVSDPETVTIKTHLKLQPTDTPHYLPFGVFSDSDRCSDPFEGKFSVDDLKSVVANGKCRLVFHFAILKFFNGQSLDGNLTEGLLRALSGPLDETGQSTWREQIGLLYRRFRDPSSPDFAIGPPSAAPKNVEEGFDSFFFRVLREEYGLTGGNNADTTLESRKVEEHRKKAKRNSNTEESTVLPMGTSPIAGLPPTVREFGLTGGNIAQNTHQPRKWEQHRKNAKRKASTEDSTALQMETSPISALPPILWPCSDLLGNVSLKNVVNETHRIKCRLLFDLILLRYVEATSDVGSRGGDEGNLAKWWSGQHWLFQKAGWSFYFFLVAFHMQQIYLSSDVYPQKDDNLFLFLMRETQNMASRIDESALFPIVVERRPEQPGKSRPHCREIHFSEEQFLTFRGFLFNHDATVLFGLI
jgi:hypothetical protein